MVIEEIQTIKELLGIASTDDILICLFLCVYGISVMLLVKWFILPLINDIVELVNKIIAKIKVKKNACK